MGSRKLFDFLRFRKRRLAASAAPATGIHSPRLSDVVGVPDYRIIASQSDVVIAASVRGGTWQDAAQLANWIAGRGVMEVPCYAPNVFIDEGETHTFRYRVRPRYVTTRYALSLRISSPTTASVNLTITVGGIASSYVARPRSVAPNVTFYFDRTAKSASVEELSFTIAGAESQPDGACTVEALALEALPRTRLICDDNECGIQGELFRQRNPILNSSVHDALFDRLNNLRDVARRPGLLQFARSDLDAWTVAGTPVSLFADGISLTGQSIYGSDTTDAGSWAALVKCSDGSTAGTIEISNVSGGASVTGLSISAGTTSWTWVDGLAWNFDCEDNTTPDGLRLARRDDHTFTATRTAGAGTISIATVSAWA
jgi:hypothetical protein